MGYEFLPASNGSGDAVRMNITANRLVGATTILVDSVVNVPTKFIGTYGSLDANGFITPASKGEFTGHVSGADLIIDAFEPGTTDVGNLQGQVVVVRPTTGWANRVAAFIKNLTNLGTPENITIADLTVANLHVTGATTADGAIDGAGYTTSNLGSVYRFLAHRNAASTPGLDAPVIFDVEDSDPNSNYNPANGRYTAPVAGWYHFDANLTVQCTGASQDTGCSLKLNGTTIFKNGTTIVNMYAGSTTVGGTVSGDVHLAAGDYVQVLCRSALALVVAGAGNNQFSGHLVSAD